MDSSKYESVLLGTEERVVEVFELSNAKKKAKAKTSNVVILSNQRLYLIGKTKSGVFKLRMGTFYINLNAITSGEKTIEKNAVMLFAGIISMFLSITLYLINQMGAFGMDILWIIWAVLAVWFSLMYFVNIKKTIRVYYPGGNQSIPCNNLSVAKVDAVFAAIANNIR